MQSVDVDISLLLLQGTARCCSLQGARARRPSAAAAQASAGRRPRSRHRGAACPRAPRPPHSSRGRPFPLQGSRRMRLRPPEQLQWGLQTQRRQLSTALQSHQPALQPPSSALRLPRHLAQPRRLLLPLGMGSRCFQLHTAAARGHSRLARPPAAARPAHPPCALCSRHFRPAPTPLLSRRGCSALTDCACALIHACARSGSHCSCCAATSSWQWLPSCHGRRFAGVGGRLATHAFRLSILSPAARGSTNYNS